MKRFKIRLESMIQNIDHHDLEIARIDRIQDLVKKGEGQSANFPEDIEKVREMAVDMHPYLAPHQIPVSRHDCTRLVHTAIHWNDIEALKEEDYGGIYEMIGRTPIARATNHPDDSAEDIHNEVTKNLKTYFEEKMIPKVSKSVEEFSSTRKASFAQNAVKKVFERRLAQLNGTIDSLKKEEARERVFPKSGGFLDILSDGDFLFNKPISIERSDDIVGKMLSKYSSIYEYALDRKLIEEDKEDGSSFQFYSRPLSFFFNQTEILPKQTEILGNSDVFKMNLDLSFKMALMLSSNLVMGVQTPVELDELMDEMRDTSFRTRIPDERTNAFMKSGFRVVGWSFSSYGAIFEESMKGVNKTFDERVGLDPELVFNDDECELSVGICLVMKHDADPKKLYFVDFKVQNEMVTVEEVQSFLPRKYTTSSANGTIGQNHLDNGVSFFHTCANSFRMKNQGGIVEEFELLLDESHANFGPDEAAKLYMALEYANSSSGDGPKEVFRFVCSDIGSKNAGLTNGFFLSRFLYSINPNIPSCAYAFCHIPTPASHSYYAQDNAVELPYLYNHWDVNAFNINTNIKETSLFCTDFDFEQKSLECANAKIRGRSQSIYGMPRKGESEDRLNFATDGANRFYIYKSMRFDDMETHVDGLKNHLVRLLALEKAGKLPSDRKWELDAKMNSRALKLASEITGQDLSTKALSELANSVGISPDDSGYDLIDPSQSSFYEYQAYFTKSGEDTRFITTYAELEVLRETETNEDRYNNLLVELERRGKDACLHDERGRKIKGWDKIKKYLKVS